MFFIFVSHLYASIRKENNNSCEIMTNSRCCRHSYLIFVFFCFILMDSTPTSFPSLPSCTFRLPPFQRASLFTRCHDELESSEALVVLLWVLVLSPLQNYVFDGLVFELIITTGKGVEKETLKDNHKTFA